MKCPICGNDLITKKQAVSVDANGESVFNEFAICHTCKKKWNLDKQRAKKAAEAKEAKAKAKPKPKKPAEPAKKEPIGQTTTFSNIPPAEVREKKEREVKANYENMLAQGEPRKNAPKKKPVKRPEPPRIEEEDDLYDDEPVHTKKKFSVLKLILILLAIAIIAVAAFLGWKIYKQKGFSNPFASVSDANAVTASVSLSDTSVETGTLSFSGGDETYTVAL